MKSPSLAVSNPLLGEIAGAVALVAFASGAAFAQAASGTNALSSFVAGKSYLNVQTTAGAPTPAPYPSYAFIATTVLASNRTAETVTVTLPSGGTSNLVQNFVLPYEYLLFAYDTNNARFESTFPEGNYEFKVTATTSNQLVTAILPTSMAQPNAPHISNYSAAQNVDAGLAFTLTWDPFQGGTAADYIFVTVGNKTFQTPAPGTKGCLSGTATSAIIPAGKLVANSNYTSQIIFYHVSGTTNASYIAGGYRATVTEFNLKTTGTTTSVPLMSNPLWGPGGLSFDVSTSPGQLLKLLFSSDPSLPITSWSTLLSTNPLGTSVHLTIPPQGKATGFFRVAN